MKKSQFEDLIANMWTIAALHFVTNGHKGIALFCLVASTWSILIAVSARKRGE